ncbi:MAG TPA: hypothetical protein VM889_11545 [Candidatus Thermoplasmatota archaeon]|nr:hypothetical protein [Candidatus Thermoplasmatota archaeon]
MSSRLTLLVALLVAAVPFAGCLGAAPAPDAGDGKLAKDNTTADEDPADIPVDDGRTPQNLSAGERPHLHDYWDGQERVTLYEDILDLDAVNALFWTVFTTYLVREPIAGGAFVRLPEGAIVYEGAGKMEITVSWNDPTVTGMRFIYRHAGAKDMSDAWIPLSKGQTYTLDLTPEMTDMPHGKTSRWFFLFAAAGTPALAIGQVNLKIDIVRMRDISLFPGHPDFWKGANETTILEAKGVAKSEQGPRAEVNRRLDPLAPPPGVVPGDKPVPMETVKLRGTVVVEAVNPSNLKVHHLHLLAKAADGWGFREMKLNASSPDKKTWTFEREVEMKNTDSPYAQQSAWEYLVRAAYEPPVPGMAPCEDGCYDAELSYALTVVAVRGDIEMDDGT